MPDTPTPAAVVCAEATAFDARHPDLRDHDAARSVGMLAWGLLRAVAACPDCPDVFRVSPDAWQTLLCPQCHGVWVYQERPPAEARKKPRPRSKERTP